MYSIKGKISIEASETSQSFCEEQGLFSCKDRWDTCVETNKVCDGNTDCYNGYDEDNCGE